MSDFSDAAKLAAKKELLNLLPEAAEAAVERLKDRLDGNEDGDIRWLMSQADDARANYALAVATDDLVELQFALDNIEDWEDALEKALEWERLDDLAEDKAAILEVLKSAGLAAMKIAAAVAPILLRRLL